MRVTNLRKSLGWQNENYKTPIGIAIPAKPPNLDEQKNKKQKTKLK
jgi:hypothetical protein